MAKKKWGHPSDAAASDETHDEAGEGFAGDFDQPTPDEAGGLTRDDVTPEGLIPSGAPVDGAVPVSLPPGPPTDADRVSALERQLAELHAMLSASAAAGTIAPAGYKLVKDELTQDAKSLAEQAAIKSLIEKGNRERSQEHANKLFPEGKHVWRCHLLADKNGHPELMIRAATPTDAVARYLAACGIGHTEHKVQCDRA